MSSNLQQIQVSNTLDVEAIERMLAELWQQTAGQSQTSGDNAVLRARAADLMVFMKSGSMLSGTQEIISELASFHPCRALLMAGDRDAPARDIEMYVSAFCANQQSSDSRNLCCEEITLTAQGHFVSELPSAAVPLLVPDLPVFLWWRDKIGAEDRVFAQLCLAADRVMIDSADFHDLRSDFLAVNQLLDRRCDEAVFLSDINWARLTPWRASLANFYDVADYHTVLDQITDVQISFVAETGKTSFLSSQSLLITSWLASRLNWKLVGATEMQQSPRGKVFKFKKNARAISVTLNEAQHAAIKPGRVCEIEMKASEASATFLVNRSEDSLHLKTQTSIGERLYPGLLVPVGNWSEAQILSREMEILCNDRIYEEAIEVAAEMLKHDSREPPA
jgi:glucose-6-phosphate dehydrogenase assembly protein OpcA